MKVVVLCGGANSGKSTTLRRLVNAPGGSWGGVYRLGGRLVHVEFSSLQEQCKMKCDAEGRRCVVDTMGEWVDEAVGEGADFLIVPFTMKRERMSGELNRVCIR